ncbi:MAG: DeoR family transcriptional regulator [Candidatus Dojkabacteria bacterium]
MNNTGKKRDDILYNLITLFSFFFGLFLIIFLRHGEGKESVQSVTESIEDRSRVNFANRKDTRQFSFNGRQNIILDKIREERSLSPKNIYAMFPGVTSRTLRRDMDSLVEQKLVKQNGVTKSTNYTYIGG